MMQPKLWLCAILLLGFVGQVSSFAQEQAYLKKAEQHFDRAGWLEANDDPAAEQEYRLAIEARGGRYPQAWLGLQRVYAAQLRFSEAATALENYMVLTPKRRHEGDVKELQSLRQAAELQSRIKSSEQPALDDLLEFIPDVVAYGGLVKGTTYAEMAVRLYPDSSQAYLILARYLPLNDPERKKRELTLLEKALELDPNSSVAHSQLGWYYFSIEGRADESDRHFRKALELSRDQNVDAWYGLAHSLTAEGQNREAISAYRNYLRLRKVPSQNDNYIKQEIKRLQRND